MIFFFPSSQITGDSLSANTTSHDQTKIPASINLTSHKQNHCVSFSFYVRPLAVFFVWSSFFVPLLVCPPVALGVLFAFVFSCSVLICVHPRPVLLLAAFCSRACLRPLPCHVDRVVCARPLPVMLLARGVCVRCCVDHVVCARALPVMLFALFALFPLLSHCSQPFVCSLLPVTLLAAFASALLCSPCVLPQDSFLH
jgi:hypothetical protein